MIEIELNDGAVGNDLDACWSWTGEDQDDLFSIEIIREQLYAQMMGWA